MSDSPAQRTILNVLWLLFSGLWLALAYAIAGVICTLLVVTLPWGLAAFRLAGYMLWPFGRAPVPGPEPGPWYDPRNLLWLLVGGVWIIAIHTVLGILFVASLVAYLFAAHHLKMIPIVANPRHWTIERDTPAPEPAPYAPPQQDTPLPGFSPNRRPAP
jgi:uncharacterized membrane protein YccF (DUF307 family)